MAKYQIGKQKAFHRGSIYKPGDTIVLPDDWKPHASFIPLDAAAEAALEKFHPNAPKKSPVVVAKAVAAAAPEKVVEPKADKKRPSDKSVL